MTRILYEARARRQLHKMQPDVARRILQKIRWYAEQEHVLSFAKHLTNPRYGTYRFEIGDYRAIFDIDHASDAPVLIILSIRHRSNVYDDI